MATYYVQAPAGASESEILRRAGLSPTGSYRITVKEYGNNMTPMGEKVYYGVHSNENVYQIET